MNATILSFVTLLCDNIKLINIYTSGQAYNSLHKFRDVHKLSIVCVIPVGTARYDPLWSLLNRDNRPLCDAETMSSDSGE